MQVLRRHARRAATLAARGSNQARCLSSAPGVIVPAVRDGLVGAIGNTPLIRLRGVSEATGCNILGKAEFMNPGGSVKDRAALGLIEAAEKDGTTPALRVAAPLISRTHLVSPGTLTAGGTVVEGTAGNTGIGLAHVCNARGYPCVIYMPDTQSQEKIDLLQALGAEVRAHYSPQVAASLTACVRCVVQVRPVPAVPITDANNYNWQARDYAASLPNGTGGCCASLLRSRFDDVGPAVWVNQFDNTHNRDAHTATTGPEIFEQTQGEVHAFTCATGTGGTLAGVGAYLKSMNPDVQIVLADPPGSVLHSWVQSHGAEMLREGSSITEGIGQGRITDNVYGSSIDDSVFVSDEVSVDMVRCTCAGRYAA